MGKFINKTYANTIDALGKGMINKVKNANYVFNDKPPVISDWYNINARGTSFDEGTRGEYSSIGTDSPIRYNKIIGAIFYSQGIKIALDVEYGDDGLAVGSQPNVSGIVLPNTWIPYAGDYFSIEHVGRKWLYKVDSVSFDTLDNGNNVYSFEAHMDNHGCDYIEKLVVERYKMIINNVGTDFNAIIKQVNYDLIDNLDAILTKLKDYYCILYFKQSVQTFIYQGTYGNLYDPYMIEFLSKNSILKGSTNYVYVSHETFVPETFAIDYDKTFFRAVETHTKNRFVTNTAIADYIDDQYSLFNTTLDSYFKIDYNSPRAMLTSFSTLDPNLVSMVQENREIKDQLDPDAIYNIIVRYFNDRPLDSSIVPIIENIDFKPNQKLFYTIPFVIYAIEDGIRKLMV